MASLACLAGPPDYGWGATYPLCTLTLLSLLTWCIFFLKSEPTLARTGLIMVIVLYVALYLDSIRQTRQAMEESIRDDQKRLESMKAK